MSFFSNLSLPKFKGNKKRTVLLLGLDSSGKTTLLSSMKPSLTEYGRDCGVEEVVTMPTSGVSLVEFKTGKVNWRCWDLSGQGRFRR